MAEYKGNIPSAVFPTVTVAFEIWQASSIVTFLFGACCLRKRRVSLNFSPSTPNTMAEASSWRSSTRGWIPGPRVCRYEGIRRIRMKDNVRSPTFDYIVVDMMHDYSARYPLFQVPLLHDPPPPPSLSCPRNVTFRGNRLGLTDNARLPLVIISSTFCISYELAPWKIKC